MSGICGWVNFPQDTELATRTLADMAGGLGRSALAADGFAATNTCAMASMQGIVPVSFHRAGALTVAVQGHAHWRSPDLVKSATDRGCAATLADAYRRRGNECLREIGGPCAIAVVDLESENALLAIDRLGIRTMCYANPQGRLVFGSTADSVAAHPAVGRRLSDQAIFNYLYCHVVPSPGTVYQGVQKLQPGECVAFRNGAFERRFYWQLRYNDDDNESLAALGDRFRGLLREAAARAVDGDAEVGAFLSGGTDSSTVAGLLAERGNGPARTYSIGFSAEGFDEMEYARITARHFSAQAHEYYVTPQDVVDAIPVVAAAYDEPFGNASAIPTYLCARMARADGVRVMLAGDGGDEIFGGNVRYAKQKMFESYWLIPAGLRRTLIEPLVMAAPGARFISPLRKVQSYVRQASVPLPDRLESYNFLNRAPLGDVLEPGFLAEIDPEQPLSLLREVYQRTASASPVNRMMHLDLKHTLADNDLRKVSRMCNVAGVDVRYPLLDEALVEFSGEIAASLKVKGVKLRYFFKESLTDFLPPETLAKTKHGFGLPFGLWLKAHKPLAELVHESLDAFGRRRILSPRYIEDLVHQHDTGHATYFGTMIWVIMTLERWLEEKRL